MNFRVIESVLRIVLEHAVNARTAQVHRVYLRVSEISHLRAEWLQRYFDHLSQGTVAEGALVAIELVIPTFVARRAGPDSTVRYERSGTSGAPPAAAVSAA